MRLILFLLIVSVTSSATGQDAGKINPNAPDPLKKLGFCIGKWEVRPQAADESVPPNGRMHAYWTLDGFALNADYRGLNRNGDVVFRGTSFRTYDASKKMYCMKWMVAGSNDHTRITGDFKNGDLVTTGKGEDRRGSFIERYRFYDIKADQFKFKMERSYDEGQTWQTHALNRYDRVK